MSGPGLADYRQEFEVRRGSNPAIRARILPALASLPAPSPDVASTFGQLIAAAQPPANEAPAPPTAPEPAAPPPAAADPPPVAEKVAAEAPVIEVRPNEVPADRGPRASKSIPAVVTLDELMTRPQNYAGRIIAPAGRHEVANAFQSEPGGLAVPVFTKSARFPNPRAAADFLVEDGLARTIRQEIAARKLIAGAQHRYEAIPTVRVLKGSRGGKEYLVELIKVEYLCIWDFERISNARYEKAFHTLTVTAEGTRFGLGDGKDWSERIGGKTLAALRKAWNTEKIRMGSMQLSAIQGAINQGVMAAGAQQQASQAAMLRKLLGGN